VVGQRVKERLRPLAGAVARSASDRAHDPARLADVCHRPLHAAGIIESQDAGLIVGLVVIAAVVFQSGMSTAVIVMLVALGLAATATMLRLYHHSTLDLYLDASAWVLIGLALSWVVARAVFAPGRITYHRVMGAILLYLAIGLTFVALYTFVGLLIPDAFSELTVRDSPALASTMVYFSFGTLFGKNQQDLLDGQAYLGRPAYAPRGRIWLGCPNGRAAKLVALLAPTRRAGLRAEAGSGGASQRQRLLPGQPCGPVRWLHRGSPR